MSTNENEQCLFLVSVQPLSKKKDYTMRLFFQLLHFYRILQKMFYLLYRLDKKILDKDLLEIISKKG